MTNEDTMYKDMHEYWTHLPLADSAINLNSTQSAETETSEEKSSDGDKGMNIADVRGNKSHTITLNSPQSAEKETADKKSPDGNAGMEVDDVKRAKHSIEVTAETSVDNETGSEPKKNKAGVATIESKSEYKSKKGLQGEFYESPTEKHSQNKGEKKYPGHWP